MRVMSVPPLEAEEKRAVERRRQEEEQMKLQEQMTVVYRRPEPVILEQKAPEPQRDVENDWFIISDVSPKESGANTHTQPQMHICKRINHNIHHTLCLFQCPHLHYCEVQLLSCMRRPERK